MSAQTKSQDVQLAQLKEHTALVSRLSAQIRICDESEPFIEFAALLSAGLGVAARMIEGGADPAELIEAVQVIERNIADTAAQSVRKTGKVVPRAAFARARRRVAERRRTLAVLRGAEE